jgi:hypothetical protein
MTSKLAVAALVFAAGLWSQSAFATIVLQDNFNSDPQMLNWTGDSTFTVVPNPPVGGQPSVDLIGTGFYDFYPGNGNYVDLDGSTGYGNVPVAGDVVSKAGFTAGTYTLTFDLGGNARGAADQTTLVTLGGVLVASLDLTSSSPLTLYTYTFAATGGKLEFADNGPSDQQGNILDNVVLTTSNGAVVTPLPPAWTMLIAGFVGLGFFAYRGGKKESAARFAAA